MPAEVEPLRFCVLGPLEVRRDDRTVDIGSAMVRTLLARLLLDAGRVVSVARLIDDLWDGAPPPSAHATLQSYVSHLRRALEPGRVARDAPSVVITRAPGYLLQVDDGTVDAQLFDRDLEEARKLLDAARFDDAVTRLDSALIRWRGEPYGDVEAESFVLGERRRLEARRFTAIEDRLTALLELGRHREALGEIEALVATAPTRERGWELLMLARYRAGHQVEALRAYRDARHALVENAGVEPGPRLIGLERRMMAQDPELEWRPAQVDADSTTVVPHQQLPPPATPLSSQLPMVGRHDALARAHSALRRTVDGRGGVLLIQGEGGIGKTRLVEEVVGSASMHGVQVAWGRSSDGDAAPAYWPWTQALSVLAASADPAAVDAGGPHLAHVLQRPDARADVATVVSTIDDPGAVRFGVQRAVISLLEQVCSTAPSVVVLDDVHWADASSLRLLAALAAELHRIPLLVIATYRRVEAAGNAALTEALAHVARRVDTERLELTGLDRAAVAEHLAAAGVSASTRLVAEVHDRSGGNPFFVTELTRLIASQQEGTVPFDGGAVARVPHAVHDVTRQRLAQLPDPTIGIMGLAAITGRSSEIAVLADAAGLEPDTVLDLLEPAVDAGLVVFDLGRPGAVCFSHDLQREAVAESLPFTRRIRLHHRVATALAGRTVEDDASAARRIAHHYAESLALGTADEVLRWAPIAARHAAQRGGDDEAVEAWAMARDAHEAAHPDDLAGRYDLVVALAHAQRGAWDLAGALRSIDDAIALAQRLDDPVRVLDAAAIPSDVTLWNWNAPGEVPSELVEPMEAALDWVGDARTPTRARALGALGVALRYGDPARARLLTDRAIDVAESLGGTDDLARALNNAYLSRWWRPHHHEMLALTDRLLALPGLRPEVEAVASMHTMLILLASGDIPRLSSAMQRAQELRQIIHQPDVVAQLDLNLATWARLHDLRDEARSQLERAYRTRYQDSTMYAGEWVYYVGRMALGDLTDNEIDLHADRLARLAQDEPADLVRPTAILALLHVGRATDARRLVDDGPRLRECWSWAFNVVQWADITVELDLPGGEGLTAQLATFADDLVVAGSNLGCFGSTHQWLARLAHHRGDHTEAAEHASLAADRHQALGLPGLANCGGPDSSPLLSVRS
jgi:DNA-binding SARP family transcriptional activator